MGGRPILWIFAACLAGMVLAYMKTGRPVILILYLLYLVLLIVVLILKKYRRKSDVFQRKDSSAFQRKGSSVFRNKASDDIYGKKQLIACKRIVLFILVPVIYLCGYLVMEKSLEPGILEGNAAFLEKSPNVEVQGRLKKMQAQGEGMGLFITDAVLICEDGRMPGNEGNAGYDEASVSEGNAGYDGVSDNGISGQYRGNAIGIRCEDIAVYVKDTSLCSNLKIGNVVFVKGTLKELEEPGNPGQFNQKLYYRSEKVYYRMAADDVSVADGSYNRLRQWLYDLKNKLSSVYDGLLSEKDAGFIKAMVLGDKSDMDKERKTLFQKNGIAHILAISGMHLSILSGMLLWIFEKTGFYKQTGCVLSLIILLLYGIMTGEGVSTMRAFLMTFMSVLAILTKRSYDMPTAAALSAMLLLFKSPLYLTQPGFLLSYGAIFGIGGIYTTYVEETGGIRTDREDGLPLRKKENPSGKKVKFVKKISSKIKTSLVFSFIVQISLLPVMLCFYYEVFAGSIILNILVIPFLPLLFLCGIFGGIAGLFCPSLGKILLYAVHIIFSLYEKGCSILMDVDQLYLITGRPSVLQIGFYGLVIIVFLFLCHFIRKKQVIFFLLFTFVLFIPFSNDNQWITFLDVGQGDSAAMGTGRKEICMVDGGSSSVNDVGTYRILPFLKYKGIKTVDYWFVTHGDKDHYSGVLEIIKLQGREHIKIRTLVLPALENEDEELEELKEAAILNGTDVFYMRPGEMVKESYSLYCIHPDSGYHTEDKNSASLVLGWECGDISGILTGDLDISGEEYILREAGYGGGDYSDEGSYWDEGEYLDGRGYLGEGEYLDGRDYSDEGEYAEKADKQNEGIYRFLPADFLKVGHHGSKGSTGEEFIKAVSPAVSVISYGKNNRYGHPHEEVIERLEDAGTVIYRTERGAVTIETDGRWMRAGNYKGE